MESLNQPSRQEENGSLLHDGFIFVKFCFALLLGNFQSVLVWRGSQVKGIAVAGSSHKADHHRLSPADNQTILDTGGRWLQAYHGWLHFFPVPRIVR